MGHILSFLPGYSQAYFGLAVAAANDQLLNKNSFAIAGDQCWENLDFGKLEPELAMRLTDYDIQAVLWCIDAANKVKRLSLTHCVNITGTCLEPLRGSTVIEQIDMSLVGRHEAPTLLELWHPPQKIDLWLLRLTHLFHVKLCYLFSTALLGRNNAHFSICNFHRLGGKSAKSLCVGD